MKLLAFSSSRTGDSGYLEPAVKVIKNYLGPKALHFAFVPFASTGSYENYLQKVCNGLSPLPHHIELVNGDNAWKLINQCDGIMVGGGNTFKLLHNLYELDLVELIREKVREGIPYVGWSAGSNILGPSIATTNDMPILQPKSFKALHVLPFQINPHYYNIDVSGFNGETRDIRLREFLAVNPSAIVIALPEGTYLTAEDTEILFHGEAGYEFRKDGPDIIVKELTDEMKCPV